MVTFTANRGQGGVIISVYDGDKQVRTEWLSLTNASLLSCVLKDCLKNPNGFHAATIYDGKKDYITGLHNGSKLQLRR